MNLDAIIQTAKNQGYEIEFDSDSSTIRTRNGDVRINLNEWRDTPRCFLGGTKRIELFRYNKDPVKDLIHEREHFQIFPYDFISFGILFGSAFAYSVYEVAQHTDGWLTPTLFGLTELVFAHKFLNLYSDTIIYLRQKLGLDDRKG